jgi:hypothetical protein
MECVPNLSNAFPLRLDKTAPLTVDQVYGVLAATVQVSPLLLEGVKELMTDELDRVGTIAGLSLVLPWVTLLTILLVVLSYNGVLQLEVAVILFGLMIVLVCVLALVVRPSINSTFATLPRRVKDLISHNANDHSVELVHHIYNSYLGVRCDSVIIDAPDTNNFTPAFSD